MDLKEAFYKQKKELASAKTIIRHQTNRINELIKEKASSCQFQRNLEQIQNLSQKLETQTSISKRYKEMHEATKRHLIEIQEKYDALKEKFKELQDQYDEVSHYLFKEERFAERNSKNEIAALKSQIAHLKAQLELNGTNAGIPTARTPIYQKKNIPNSREKSNLKRGGQPGHKKSEMKPFADDEITDTVIHSINTCPDCNSSNLEEIDEKIKDEYEYTVVVKKIRHRFKVYKCLDCGSIVRVPYNGLVAANQYGKNIQAMALSLMNVGFVSINRVKKILTGFSSDSIRLSEGYISKLQKRYSDRLSGFVADIKNRICKAPLLYWDDTVIFVNTSRACMRFYGTEKIALYSAHKHKDLDGLMQDNILPMLSRKTYVMHDHNTVNYHEGFAFRNIECLQHLERDLQKISDNTGHSWATDLKELIKKKIHERNQRLETNPSFSQDEKEDIIMCMEVILEKGREELRTDENNSFKKEERALLRRLGKYKENYLAWIHDFSLPTTNNLSERSLRFVKTKDKVSGQFQNIEHATYFANIRTYLETCARNGVNEFTALLRLTSNKPFSVTELLGEE